MWGSVTPSRTRRNGTRRHRSGPARRARPRPAGRRGRARPGGPRCGPGRRAGRVVTRTGTPAAAARRSISVRMGAASSPSATTPRGPGAGRRPAARAPPGGPRPARRRGRAPDRRLGPSAGAPAERPATGARAAAAPGPARRPRRRVPAAAAAAPPRARPHRRRRLRRPPASGAAGIRGLEQGDGPAGDALAAAEGAEALGPLGFDAHGGADHRAQPLSPWPRGAGRAGGPRGRPRNRRCRPSDQPSGGHHDRHLPPRGQQLHAVGAAPGRVGVGEQAAEVAQPGGAEQGVGHGVGDHVGVAVAGQARAVEGHAAEDQPAAGVVAERVDVEAQADPASSRPGLGGLAPGRHRGRPPPGLRVGDLHVVRVAGHQHDPAAGRLDQGGVVGGVCRRRRGPGAGPRPERPAASGPRPARTGRRSRPPRRRPPA